MNRSCPASLRVSTALLAGAALALSAAAPASAGDNKRLLMHYMPWFESPDVRGFWGNHWTSFQNDHDPDTIGPDGYPDIWSNYNPMIGPYDSADPDVLEYQLLTMKLAGVDGVIADWYSIEPVADYPLIHFATERLFEACGELGMEFAVCYEDRTVEYMVSIGYLQQSQIASHLGTQFQWMQDNWFGTPHYVRYQNRPLLLNFGPIYVSSPAPWAAALGTLSPRPVFFPLHQLWESINADGGFNWVHTSAWDGNPSESVVRQRLTNIFNNTSTDPAEVIPSANAGFDDVYVPGGQFPYLDHRDGDTLRVMLDVGMDGPWDIIQLVTWNDYTEGTMIEPTHEFGYTFLEVIQQARVQEQGAAFPFTPDDLRLPALLLELRRGGVVPDATLDQVSDHLRDGETGQAAGLLANLLGDVITEQPGDAIADAGGTLVFEASAGSALPGLVLRWERDGEPVLDDGRISGAATESLTIVGANALDVGEYRLVASIGSVEIASEPAVGAVRRSPLGPADFNNDGSIDGFDLLAFLVELAAALP